MYNLLKKGNTCNNKVFKEDYMKRNMNLKKVGENNINDKIISYAVVGAIIVAIIIISLLLYSQQINQDVQDETMTLEQMTNMIGDTSNNVEETESASTEIGKTVEESQAENQVEEESTQSQTTQNTSSNQTVESSANTTENTTQSATQNTISEEETTQEVKELSFQRPVEGEIIKEFAQDNLVYSETLQEWVTHNGIDIKADKTTVVKSAEAGVIKSIKNDPRYGLTIVIEHDDVYQTVYSNLLTSEFVVEGETVEKGQSIGTVGNSAVFEIADEPHLHFEILKNSVQEDPTIYIQ